MNVSETYTSCNQAILRRYAEKIAQDFDVQPKEEPSYLWNLVGAYLPSWETAGKGLGEHLVQTHGQSWSNNTIDFVVRKCFQQEVKQVSRWSLEGMKQLVTGATQVTLAETLKITFTPKALPYMTCFAGVTGQIALPLVVNLVGLAYQKVMGDPQQVKKLANLSLDALFTVDPETNRLRDAFGRLLTKEDMQDIFVGTAEYDLVGKLIQLCQEIDKKSEETIESEAKALIKKLVKTYRVKRSDGVVIFPDGSLRTMQDKEIIKAGVEILKRVNPRKRSEEIQNLVKLLSSHSILPLDYLTPSDIDQCMLGTSQSTLPAKRMPAVFDGKDEWKNFIVRATDGCYYMSQDCMDKKRGDVISNKEMKVIFRELDKIECQKSIQQNEELAALMGQPNNRSILIDRLNQMDAKQIGEFLKSYLIERQCDGQAVYIDGTFLEKEEKQKLLQNLALIPSRNNLVVRRQKLELLVNQIAEHAKSDELTGGFMICCQDGLFITKDGTSIPGNEVEFILEQLKLAQEERMGTLSLNGTTVDATAEFEILDFEEHLSESDATDFIGERQDIEMVEIVKIEDEKNEPLPVLAEIV